MPQPAQEPENDTHDRRLMRRVAGEDDEAAFGLLYERYRHRATLLARSVTRCPDLAEEAVQEAFVAVWDHRAGYEPERGTVAAWALTIVRHEAIRLSRRAARTARSASADEVADRCVDPADICRETIAHDELRALLRLVDRLPLAQSRVVHLAFFGDLTHAEIADRLGLPAGTVKGRMRLGLARLRRTLAPEAEAGFTVS
jgi:RNA polymerase sigma-70 factor (ECF subfamily)